MTQDQDRGLYIQLFSVHGLIRGDNLEMGRDADTGGQVKYVVELARALGRSQGVRRVDLFTRLIRDPRVSEDYGRRVERLDSRVRLVRIQCGGLRYRRKELLWPHLDEYVDKTLKFARSQGELPDIVHGHYADAGYVAMHLAEFWGVPFVFTGHSLGRSKRQKLADEGLSAEEMNRRYFIDHRIEVEEEVLQRADLVVTSTRQEIEEQYRQYRNHGLARYEVTPPGIDLSRFFPYYDEVPEHDHPEEHKRARANMDYELNRFLTHPDKPLVLALSRPDKRKNIPGLIEAYGSDKELQAIANLAIFAGIRRDIAEMEDNEREVLTEMLLLMDRYDLYGKMAIPKRHDPSFDVPALYRLAASRRGVFVNPALTEPFGLTLLEAAACGLPIVATRDGGPVDIVENCRNGLLVDVREEGAIAEALRTILVDREKWEEYSRNGVLRVREHYSWEAHCRKYLEAVRQLRSQRPRSRRAVPIDVPVGKRLQRLDRFLVTDVDRALLEEPEAAAELGQLLRRNRDRLGFIVATSRSVDSASQALAELDLPEPDVLVTSVGTEIYYASTRIEDRGWAAHIAVDWKPGAIREVLEGIEEVEPQADEHQRRFKLSYLCPDDEELLLRVKRQLAAAHLRFRLLYSFGSFLDILPYRASKGKALRYLSYKWSTPLDCFLVVGGSGTDLDMLTGDPQGVVVANHSPELAVLQGRRRIAFSRRRGAAAVLEGLRHYKFLERDFPAEKEGAPEAEAVGSP